MEITQLAQPTEAVQYRQHCLVGLSVCYSPDSTVININRLQFVLCELIFERLSAQMLHSGATFRCDALVFL